LVIIPLTAPSPITIAAGECSSKKDIKEADDPLSIMGKEGSITPLLFYLKVHLLLTFYRI